MKLLMLALTLLMAVALRAQPFSIDWFTIDGGGGTSTGGAFSLSGTIGQPDAGAMGGGSFSLEGGFWAGATAIQTPGAPFLYVSNSVSGAVVYWERPASGFVLDETTTLAPASWTQRPWPYQTNSTHIFITVSPTGHRFFRLRHP
jgi:hypothetical protein